MEQNNSKKELRIYNGTLKEYTEELWKNKRGDGTVVNLGEIHPAIVRELAKINILLEDTRVIVDQRSATKYFTHPNRKRERYSLLMNMDCLKRQWKNQSSYTKMLPKAIWFTSIPILTPLGSSSNSLSNPIIRRMGELTTMPNHGVSFRKVT